MRFTPNDLPPHIKRLNPHLFGVALAEAHQSKPKAALDRSAPPAPSRKAGPRFRVAIVCHVAREWDGDNLQVGCKQIRDGIAEFLGCDDNERFIEWRYGHIVNPGSQGIDVKIWQLT